MNNEETKYFAVTANNIMWMLIIIVLFSMAVFVFMSHKIDVVNQNLIKQTIDSNNELSNLKIKFERLEERVDWNEDQLVKFHDWKDKVYHEKALNIESKNSGGN